jgi:hypothetical protein
VDAIYDIVNDAAEAYRGAIPTDCWHEPYMSGEALRKEITAGVSFSGWEDSGELFGVIGLQRVADASLIRHAYVRTEHWAIRFYERRGFKMASPNEADKLLQIYWNIAPRPRETSVVLECNRA